MDPRLRDALDMLFGTQRFSAQHAAKILRVDIAALERALAALEKTGLAAVTKRGTPAEAWASNVGDGSVAALVARLEEDAAGTAILEHVLT